jgi:hypothetical protein
VPNLLYAVNYNHAYYTIALQWYPRYNFDMVKRAASGVFQKRTNEEALSDFYGQIEKSESCWNWTGPRQAFGYGTLWFNGKMWSAHRLSYSLHIGPIPSGLSVLHSCDNPRCVNPDHLRSGTQADNIGDMVGRGRMVSVRGERKNLGVLIARDVVGIRADRKSGLRLKEIAAKYQCSMSNVSRIATNKLWTHVAI